MKTVFRFLLGSGEPWERKLVLGRIVAIAIAVLSFYALLQSPWKTWATPLFWIFALAVVASLVYQYARRWRERRTDHQGKP